MQFKLKKQLKKKGCCKIRCYELFYTNTYTKNFDREKAEGGASTTLNLQFSNENVHFTWTP